MQNNDAMDATGETPYIFANNWGHWGNLPMEKRQLTSTNADGEPVVEMTEEQKFLFDANGWLLFPGLIPEDDLTEMRDFCMRLKFEPETLPPHQRTPIAGPLERLLDHPVLVGFCNEFLAYPAMASEDNYGFRFEASFLLHRKNGDGKFAPHNGNGLWRFPGNSHIYRHIPGKGYSGLTRVVWELNPVEEGDGGTLFVNGSHKAAYKLPDSTIKNQDSPIWSTYSCPAGSLIIFTESTTHSGQPWTNERVDRVPVFNMYNSIGSYFHWWQPPAELLAEMSPKRRSLFRHIYPDGNTDTAEANEFLNPLL